MNSIIHKMTLKEYFRKIIKLYRSIKRAKEKIKMIESKAFSMQEIANLLG